jgi:hypothetical protein
MLIANNKIYANSFTESNDNLFDGISVGENANFGTIVNNKIYSSVSSESPFSMRHAVNFLGAHEPWTIAGNDFTLLTAGNNPMPSDSVVVNGLLSTDKADCNWIRTQVIAARSANFNSAASGAWVVFPFDNESNDPLNEFNSGIFIPKNTGHYQIEVKATFLPAAANEGIGLALYTSAGVAIRRVAFVRSVGASSEMVGGVVTEFLTAGVSYEIRYITNSNTSQVLAGAEFTYIKIKAVAQ